MFINYFFPFSCIEQYRFMSTIHGDILIDRDIANDILRIYVIAFGENLKIFCYRYVDRKRWIEKDKIFKAKKI